jgi:antitoxin component YwqK of YwqJK toxin-antitoxin module
MRIYFVAPPTNFTGVWRIYYANGQMSGKGAFTNGHPDGECIGFHPSGKKMVVNHSVNGLLDGEEVAFYPSGQVEYRGQFREGNRIGTWRWFKEDGTVQSERDYSKPKLPEGSP